jgi:two-component system sensor kinase FixL
MDVAEIREILKDIIEDDRRAGEVIRRLRSMLQTGTVEMSEVDVNEVIAGVMKLLAADATLRRVAIECELAQRVLPVHGDRIQLQQVILNLVVNAMDAMKGVSPDQRQVILRTISADPSTVLVSVTDRGHGIGADKLGRIFQPFFSTKAEGMGMGLTIARTIVEAHGGVLWAVNNPDRGASFLCRLPASLASERPGGSLSETELSTDRVSDRGD